LVGIIPGVLIGRWLEDTIAEKRQSKRSSIREQAFEELQDLFLETLFQKSEERISSGQVVNDEEITNETIDQVVPVIAQKYGLSREEMDEIALRFVAHHRRRGR
jgi:predicted transcriptional regulator